MSLMTWTEKPSKGLPYGRQGFRRPTGGSFCADEVRAPPTGWASTTTWMGSKELSSGNENVTTSVNRCGHRRSQ